MSIQNENTLTAVAVVAFDGAILGSQGIAGVERTAAGRYTVTLSQPMAAAERVVGMSSSQPLQQFAWPTDSEVSIRLSNDAGADTDGFFTLEVHQLPTGV